MRQLIELQADRLLDLGVVACMLSGLVAFMMLATPQPARRLRIARLGFIGVLCLPMLDQVAVLPDLNIGPFVSYALAMARSWVGSQHDISQVAPIPSQHAILSLSKNRIQSWPTLPVWVGWLYVSGVALLLGRLCLGGFLSSWLRSARYVASPELLQCYLSLPFTGEQRPALGVSDRIHRPLLLGLFNPLILIPRSLADREVKAALVVLTHELSHAEENDTAFGLLAECLLVIAFPVLPLWWIRRQSRLDQELLADARTVDRLGDPAAYASALLSFAGPALPTSPLSRIAGPALQATKEGSNLYRRILLLLRTPIEIETHPPLNWLARTTALIFGMTLCLGLVNFRPNSGLHDGGRIGSAGPRTYKIASLMLTDSTALEVLAPTYRNYQIVGKLLAPYDAMTDLDIMGVPVPPAPAFDPTGSPRPYLMVRHFRIDVAGQVCSIRWDQSVEIQRISLDSNRVLRFRSSASVPVCFFDMTATESTVKTACP